MAFVNAGYDGTVDEVQFAKLLNRYAVVGPDDFKASNTTGDRMLSIANGTALGPGSLNVGTAFSPIQFDAVTSGTTRWDLVVLRRNWQPASGTTTLEVVKGGASPVLPSRNQNPGVIDDQPLYLQQVNAGSTSLGTRIDLRVWQGPGGAEAADKLALTYLAQPGAAVKVGQSLFRYELGANGVWAWADSKPVVRRAEYWGMTAWEPGVPWGPGILERQASGSTDPAIVSPSRDLISLPEAGIYHIVVRSFVDKNVTGASYLRLMNQDESAEYDSADFQSGYRTATISFPGFYAPGPMVVRVRANTVQPGLTLWTRIHVTRQG